MLEEATASWNNVEIKAFDGLLVDFAELSRARIILRGIRAVSDYEYEFQMALMNRRLKQEVETVFLVPSETYSFLSSSLVKEVARLGGKVSGLVPASVERRLKAKFETNPTGKSGE